MNTSPIIRAVSLVADDDALVAGAYRIVSPMGASHTGQAYLAREALTDRLVVIKLMHDAKASRSTHPLRRFRREARALARLDDPHIARLLATGETADGRRYLVTEYVEGRSLQTLLDRFRWLPQPRAVALLDRIAAALEAAHAHGLVHRNLKPKNVIVSEQRDGADAVKLVGFGLVKDTHAAEADRTTSDNTLMAGLVRGVVGTPRYLSPEQAAGKRVDHRSDLYTLGLVAYEALCGAAPFDEDSAFAYAYKHISVRPTMPSERMDVQRIHPALEAILARLLAKDPDERYPSVAALRDDLARAQVMLGGAVAAPSPTSAPVRPRRLDRGAVDLWIIAAVAFAAGLLGALLG